MDPTGSSTGGSMNSVGITDSLRFHQEIHGLTGENEPGPQSGSSFTALLDLPANQAMELLHEPEAGGRYPAISSEVWRDQKPLDAFPFGCCLPTFPSNPDLVERAAKFSVFAAGESPQTTNSGRSNSGVYQPKSVKPEPVDSDSNPNSSTGSKPPPPPQRPGKRKEQEKNKAARAPAKRAKSGAEDGAAAKSAEEKNGGGGGEREKLPYVHVRARRGQATDSHSLAERARREKINARMKLLQELVPGCNKISGTAQVLDEIIIHVQSLQRQVEFLSMRLAAVNPRIDFSGIDSFLASSGRTQEAGVGGAPGLEQPLLWLDALRQQQQQIWLADLLPAPQSYSSSPPPLWGRDDDDHRGLVPPGNSLFRYDSLNSGNYTEPHSESFPPPEYKIYNAYICGSDIGGILYYAFAPSGGNFVAGMGGSINLVVSEF